MITPLFSVSQADRSLNLRIRAPHSRPKDIEIRIDGYDFHFYCSPYLLHLRFEHPLQNQEDDPTIEESRYDLESGICTVILRKLPPYPHFEKLNMLSTLLVSRSADKKPPSIEVISTVTDPPTEKDMEDQEKVSEGGVNMPLRELSITRPKYGFAMRYEGLFSVRAEDISQIVELKDPDNTPVWRRPSLRKAVEDLRFNADHYIMDFIADDFNHVFEWKFDPSSLDSVIKDQYAHTLINLPKREYLKDVNAGAVADLGGLLFAAAYDTRTTMGERNVESAWTISRICASMSWLQGFTQVSDAIGIAFRRSLIYPLYRNFKLSQLVLGDLKSYVHTDIDSLRSRILITLLDVKNVFEGDGILRLFSDLHLIDYLVWVQNVEQNVLEKFRDDVLRLEIKKTDTNLALNQLEHRAIKLANGESLGNMQQENAQPEFLQEASAVHQGTRVVSTCTTGDIKISALSGYPDCKLDMTPVSTRSLTPKDNDKRPADEQVNNVLKRGRTS